jgi:predicted N-formylglutamate amidohydrolase
MKRAIYLVSCEHGGHRIPSRYRSLFNGHEALLSTHRGYDAGALQLAQELAGTLHVQLHVATVSRLLIDLNRSHNHPRLYSEITHPLPETIRNDIRQHYYLPYRSRVEMQIAQAIAGGSRVTHFSCHSFTPELDGRLRDADVGLLYDPARCGERALCRRWRAAFKQTGAGLKVRLNYPYAGTSDGFTTALRQKFPEDVYSGIEVELNQRHVAGNARHWRPIRRAIAAALVRALASG